MASLLQPVDDRFADILERGVGTSRTIPNARFRRSADRMSLLDPNYPGQWLDRTYFLEYLTIADHEQDRPQNPYAPAWLVDLTINLRVGYLQGAGAAPGWNPSTAGAGETAAFAVRNARARALNDAQRAWRALNANFRDTSTDPQLVDCVRVGPVVLDDLGNGRLVATSTFRVLLQLDPAQDYEPEL